MASLVHVSLNSRPRPGDIDLNQIVVNAVIAASEQGNLCAAPKWLRFQQAVHQNEMHRLV